MSNKSIDLKVKADFSDAKKQLKELLDMAKDLSTKIPNSSKSGSTTSNELTDFLKEVSNIYKTERKAETKRTQDLQKFEKELSKVFDSVEKEIKAEAAKTLATTKKYYKDKTTHLQSYVNDIKDTLDKQAKSEAIITAAEEKERAQTLIATKKYYREKTKALEGKAKNISNELGSDLKRLSTSDSILNAYSQNNKAEELAENRFEGVKGNHTEAIQRLQRLDPEKAFKAERKLEDDLQKLRENNVDDIAQRKEDLYLKSTKKIIDESSVHEIRAAKKVQQEKERAATRSSKGGFDLLSHTKTISGGVVAGTAAAAMIGRQGVSAYSNIRSGRRAAAEIRNRGEMELIGGNELVAGLQKKALSSMSDENAGTEATLRAMFTKNPLRWAYDKEGLIAESASEVLGGRRDTLSKEQEVQIASYQNYIKPQAFSRMKGMRGSNLTDEDFTSANWTAANYGVSAGQSTQDLSTLSQIIGSRNAGKLNQKIIYEYQQRLNVGVEEQADFMEFSRGKGSGGSAAQSQSQLESIMRRSISYGLDSSKTGEALKVTKTFIESNAGFSDIDAGFMNNELLKQARAFANIAGRSDLTTGDMERSANAEQRRRQESTGKGGGLSALGNYLNVLDAMTVAKDEGGELTALQMAGLLNMSSTAKPEVVRQMMIDSGMDERTATSISNNLNKGNNALRGGAALGLNLGEMSSITAAQNGENAEDSYGYFRASREKQNISSMAPFSGNLPKGGIGTDSGDFVITRALKDFVSFEQNFGTLRTATNNLTDAFVKAVSIFNTIGPNAGAGSGGTQMPGTAQSNITPRERQAASPRGPQSSRGSSGMSFGDWLDKKGGR